MFNNKTPGYSYRLISSFNKSVTSLSEDQQIKSPHCIVFMNTCKTGDKNAGSCVSEASVR